METYTLVMWARPRDENFYIVTQRVYDILTVLQEYGTEAEPKYLTARSKTKIQKFKLDYQAVKELIEKNLNQPADTVFPNLGCTISLFSSINSDKSCSVRMRVGVSNIKFKNSLVVHFPATFSGYEERILDFENLFRKAVQIFEPFWGCISNDKNIEMFNNKYWISDKLSTIHWINYFNKEIIEELGQEKFLSNPIGQMEDFSNGYLYKMQNELLSIIEKSHLERQRKMNKYFGLSK